MTGYVIGILVELSGEPAPVRCYFALGIEDRAKAEWTAVDAAQDVRSEEHTSELQSQR